MLGAPVGEVVIDRDGAHWLTLSFVGTVRFVAGNLGTVFDSNSGVDRAIGVALDKTSGQAIRFRQRKVIAPPRAVTFLSAVVGTQPRYLGTLQSNTPSPANLDEVVARGRSLSTDLGYVVRSATWGIFNTSGRALSSTQIFAQPTNLPCGEPQELRASTPEYYSSPRGQDAFVCTTRDSKERWWTTGRRETNERNAARGVREIDGDGNVWFASLTRASIVRFGVDGGVTEIPLTDASPDSPDYVAMIPRSMHYDVGLDQLYIVTRGANDVPEFWEIANLP